MITGVIIMGIMVILGAPLFTIIAFSAIYGFYSSDIDLQVIAIEIYRISNRSISRHVLKLQVVDIVCKDVGRIVPECGYIRLAQPGRAADPDHGQIQFDAYQPKSNRVDNVGGRPRNAESSDDSLAVEYCQSPVFRH